MNNSLRWCSDLHGIDIAVFTVLRDVLSRSRPHPKSLSPRERDSKSMNNKGLRLPFALWEKGLGDEGE